MLTRTCQHAIRAMIVIAQKEGDGFVSTRSVGLDLDIPISFLAKVLLRLTTSNLLESRRGPHGGVRLSRTPDTVRLAEIVEAIDGRRAFEACVYGWPDCSRTDPCPLHAAWGFAVDPFVELLETTTLGDAAGLMSASNGALKSDKRLSSLHTR